MRPAPLASTILVACLALVVTSLAPNASRAQEEPGFWDGADDRGRMLARGVYFTQVRYLGRGFTEARKLTILK